MQPVSIRTFGTPHHYVYRTQLYGAIDDEHAYLLFDLGFHVRTVHRRSGAIRRNC